ncbi:AAA family ATPase [Vibrio campbellii]|uniref:AAA family ATPase n=1 Tax=Vibrio campbellii TaxID=680 RepID=UPI0020CA8EC7|nr:AAA family ATPase [Vibrio campbellii]
MDIDERCLFIGVKSQKNHGYDYDPNLFGAPGGNGEVGRIVSSKYEHLDAFFTAIPRCGEISDQQIEHLVELFRTGVAASGGSNFPFVFLTRILTVCRPDYFVSAAAGALKALCKALAIKQVKGFDEYWRVLLPKLHKITLFNGGIGDPTQNHLALIDGIVCIDESNKITQIVSDNSASYSLKEGVQSQEKDNMASQISPHLNQILYGPPGTGKTYHTIEAAVKAAEPEYYSSLNIDLELGATVEQRKSLQEKYKELTKDGRIRFVTFHQSYGYEEFVEGLRAISNQDNQIEYQLQPGVFKQICLDATASVSHQPSTLKRDARIWKLSIDGVKQSKVREYCFTNDLAAIGWGNTGDMSDEDRTTDQIGYFEQLGPLAKSSVMEFSGRMAEGDIVVCVKGQWSIQAIGVVSGDYQYREQGIEGRADFCHTMPVKWLAKDIDVNLFALNDNTRLTLKTCYELTRFNSTELYELLKSEGVSLSNSEKTNDQPQNYVLVIDEINRGNISKIFGELITLIEPSKRKGSDESIELTLPQSKKPFSVPSNLYMIGTMNTADRSLAMMDTALRRRFDFVEMMPKPELLKHCVVKHDDGDIDLSALLTKLNERIEILYDREHTLGHAFFMPVKALVEAGEQGKAFNALVSVFKNKIIPLLEEYFFEDWSKIRLVLADNQKKDTDLQFVLEHKQSKQVLDGLFGRNHNLDQYGQEVVKYALAADEDDLWNNAKAYIGIYKSTEEAPTQSPESQTEANKEPV